MKRAKSLSFILSVSIMYGCSYPGALFVEDVQVSLETSISTTDTRPVHINFGYDRTMFSMSPKKNPNGKAVSLLSKSDLKMQFTEETEIRNIFVSGRAAKLISENPERVEALFLTNDGVEGGR